MYVCVRVHFQATLFVTIRPFSKSLYRRINRFVAELLWLQLVWLVDWWAGVKVCEE
jgi:lysophosphatidic acid acyltransferase / lysophosphatidylinositol acyltransferase